MQAARGRKLQKCSEGRRKKKEEKAGLWAGQRKERKKRKEKKWGGRAGLGPVEKNEKEEK